MVTALAAGLTALGAAVPAQAQMPAASGQVVREIDDPFNGARWLLVRDNESPAGPGRLVLIEPGRDDGPQSRPTGAPGSPGMNASSAQPVVRAGERLVVEENTAVVESRLEAVALGPAAVGMMFDARLRIGGHVVRAVALAPGRALLAPEMEARQ